MKFWSEERSYNRAKRVYGALSEEDRTALSVIHSCMDLLGCAVGSRGGLKCAASGVLSDS